ncbi:MFS transporter [Pontibacillus litoralis]|uniref:MFS transporter n=1 Tax=Pontibacillus litoralis JSM 072002 TaxID=1385512 RepID=A0A0A5G2I5_9BACI|nr:MFS transporter [Pontibacillus litoralis]KGX85300.1 MFS transporter [Pontibacillus litoralis JSM 072002]
MNKKIIRSWALYDWANSAFATTIMAAVLPIFYTYVAASTIDPTLATSYWGYTQSIAVLIVAILAPILGAISDYTASKMKFLRFFAILGMLSTLLLVFVDSGEYFFASLIVILGTVGFSGANVFYDAFLPEVAKGSNIDRVSSMGYALGYFGGGILLAINLFMIQNPSWFGLASETAGTKLAFVTVSIWWFVFSIPLFTNVKDHTLTEHKPRPTSYVKLGFSRVGRTFKEINQYKQLTLFLVAFWLYNDGISTIIVMATSYGASIGIGSSHMIAALLITQFVGIPCTFLFGWLAERITGKKALLFSLYVYVVIILLGFFMTSAVHFYILATLVGVVQGGAQALSRSLFGKMAPPDRHAEFFGFFGISSKFAAIFGPFLFATVGALTGSSRMGILSILLFFIVGVILLHKIDVHKGIEEAENATNHKLATR